jgi:GntR family transcriptional regulator, transcriptional repressor for pyruvate dehydrogenase complex
MVEPESLFHRVKKVRVSDSVVELIMSLIVEGKLQLGDQLPGERELVERLQVARASVREALRILEFQGVIEVQPGKGAFVVGDGIVDSDEEGVRRWFRDHASEVMEILEVRDALEGRAARLAAQRVSNEEIQKLQSIIHQAYEEMDRGDMDKLVNLDREFHRTVSNASQVLLLSQLIDMNIDAMISPRRSLMRLPERARRSWEDHQSIIDAIASKEPDAAEKAVAEHIARVRKEVIALLQLPSDL